MALSFNLTTPLGGKLLRTVSAAKLLECVGGEQHLHGEICVTHEKLEFHEVRDSSYATARDMHIAGVLLRCGRTAKFVHEVSCA